MSATRSFNFAGKVHWYPHHMARADASIRDSLRKMDCVIEVRDARIPLSSASHGLEEAAKRVVVLNKADLANSNLTFQHLDALRCDGVAALATDTLKRKGFRGILPMLLKSLPSKEFSSEGYRVLVCGVPNVGKSSLINGLRYTMRRKTNQRTRIAKVGAVAGITKSVSSIRVSDDPSVYVLDTPGVLLPNIEDTEIGLRLALVGSLKDHLVGEEVLCDYLFFRLSALGVRSHLKSLRLDSLPPSTPSEQYLQQVAARLGHASNTEKASRIVLKEFRRGALGRITLDQIGAATSISPMDVKQ